MYTFETPKILNKKIEQLGFKFESEDYGDTTTIGWYYFSYKNITLIYNINLYAEDDSIYGTLQFHDRQKAWDFKDSLKGLIVTYAEEGTVKFIEKEGQFLEALKIIQSKL